MSALRQLDAHTWVDLDQVESITTRRHSSRRDGAGGGREVLLKMRSGDSHVVVAVQDGWQADRHRGFNYETEVDAELRRWLLERIGLEHLSPRPEEQP